MHDYLQYSCQIVVEHRDLRYDGPNTIALYPYAGMTLSRFRMQVLASLNRMLHCLGIGGTTEVDKKYASTALFRRCLLSLLTCTVERGNGTVCIVINNCHVLDDQVLFLFIKDLEGIVPCASLVSNVDLNPSPVTVVFKLPPFVLTSTVHSKFKQTYVCTAMRADITRAVDTGHNREVDIVNGPHISTNVVDFILNLFQKSYQAWARGKSRGDLFSEYASCTSTNLLGQTRDEYAVGLEMLELERVIRVTILCLTVFYCTYAPVSEDACIFSTKVPAALVHMPKNKIIRYRSLIKHSKGKSRVTSGKVRSPLGFTVSRLNKAYRHMLCFIMKSATNSSIPPSFDDGSAIAEAMSSFVSYHLSTHQLRSLALESIKYSDLVLLHKIGIINTTHAYRTNASMLEGNQKFKGAISKSEAIQISKLLQIELSSLFPFI